MTPESAKVYWFTGLSGAGKSTMCARFVEHLRKRGETVVMLDGDALREVMAAEDAHTRSERLAIGMKYARLCQLLASQNLTVAIATISMFKEVHAWNRQNIPGYVEVFLDVPLDELIQRDPKQIYQRALRAEISNVAGLDLEVDVPQDPDVVLHGGNGVTADMAFAELLKQIGARDDRA